MANIAEKLFLPVGRKLSQLDEYFSLKGVIFESVREGRLCFFMKSVRGKRTAMFVMVSVVATLAVGGYFIYTTISDNEKLVAEYRKELSEHYDRELKLQTEGVVSSLNGIYARQQSGELTEERAKEMAKDVIRSVRYDEGKGYFFADEKIRVFA